MAETWDELLNRNPNNRGELYLRVRLRVLATAEGGRSSPFFHDYRPDWDIGSHEGGLNGAPIWIEGQASVAPGSEATVRLVPLAPEFWGHVAPGMEIAMHEGPRVVGAGVVIEVCTADHSNE